MPVNPSSDIDLPDVCNHKLTAKKSDKTDLEGVVTNELINDGNFGVVFRDKPNAWTQKQAIPLTYGSRGVMFSTFTSASASSGAVVLATLEGFDFTYKTRTSFFTRFMCMAYRSNRKGCIFDTGEQKSDIDEETGMVVFDVAFSVHDYSALKWDCKVSNNGYKSSAFGGLIGVVWDNSQNKFKLVAKMSAYTYLCILPMSCMATNYAPNEPICDWVRGGSPSPIDITASRYTFAGLQ